MHFSYLKSSFNVRSSESSCFKAKAQFYWTTEQAFEQSESLVTALAAPRGLNKKEIPAESSKV